MNGRNHGTERWGYVSLNNVSYGQKNKHYLQKCSMFSPVLSESNLVVKGSYVVLRLPRS